MTRQMVLVLLLLGFAGTTFSRTVDNSPIEDVELENVETFGDVEKKLDKLFDTFDDVIGEHTERVSKGETPNDDALNEKLFEVIEDAEDLDDDIADLVDNLDHEDDESEFEDHEDKEERKDRINDDLDIMETDATLLASDARLLAESVDTNPNGSKKATSDPIIKAEMEKIKNEAENVLTALKKSEKKVKEKRQGTKKVKSKVLDEDMKGAQSDVYNPYVPVSSLSSHETDMTPHRIYVAPDLASSKPVPPPRHDVINVPQPGDNADPDTEPVHGDPFSHASSPDGDTSFLQPNDKPDTSTEHDGLPDHEVPDPAVLKRMKARMLELEREEEENRRQAMAKAVAQPSDPRAFPQNGRTFSDTSSRGRYSPANFDESFGRSNMQYFNIDGLKRYTDGCTDCADMHQTTTCPLHSEVLELKKWATELQELLSFGCKKPDSCTTPGICCINNRYPFEQTVVQMSQMMKDVYHLLQDRCTRGCYEEEPPEKIVEIPWTSWSEWSNCDVTCGQGIQERRRTCPSEKDGGSCPGDSYEIKMCEEKPCCQDGSWGTWQRWSSCSATCGTGSRTRNRDCNYPAPNYCGQTCPGLPVQTDTCVTGVPCVICVDGNWGMWGNWESCSTTCGRGNQLRRRYCDRPSPNSCGQSCPGVPVEARDCDDGPCCVDGNWGTWQRWSSCSVTCGTGSRARNRDCDSPAANYCGQTCRGLAVQRDMCVTPPCVVCVDGNWAQWSRWSQCSASCGQGVATRNRVCSDPAPNYCGESCLGDGQETRQCGNAQDCCVDGNWGSWNRWTSCSATCGRGTKSRIRRCDSPSPNFCGMRCPGSSFDSLECNEGMCCVDGNWGMWGNWESCSTTCGRGNQLRRRYCDRPPPNSCGQSCPGIPVEARDCNDGPCCVDGNWGTWQRWSSCSATCGTGSRTRNRDCDSPAANYCGQTCPGLPVQTDSCDTGVPCVVCVDGNWGSWQRWSTCSASCGQGTRERTRACDMPRPNYCGMDCFGSGQVVEPCNSEIATVNGNWGSWTRWSSCSASCGQGQRERMRECNNPAKNACGRECPGDPFQVENCDDGPCIDCGRVRWDTWGSWSRCSATCGTGLRMRSRTCNNPYPLDCNDQNYCRGPRTEEEPCGSGVPCCDDVRWSTWSMWSPCSSTCGTGVIERARKCLNARPGCMDSCRGAEMENQSCTNSACCDNVQWTSWGRWTSCSVTCGRGVQERMRDCVNPSPGLCPDNTCVGVDKSEQSCDTGVPCCVDGNWASWSLWSSCSVSCGFGTIERRRVCNNPPRNYCGRECPGLAYETDVCEQLPCITCVDGNWGMWETWSRCSVTCGGGSRERRRRCNNPPNNFCGEPCPGREYDTDTCNNNACPPDCIDGNWGSWGSWSSCPVTCGQAVVERYRSCDSPAPNFCGDTCRGDADERISTTCGPPRVNGNWSPWSSWSVCSASCGSGQQIRSRLCNSPAPNACGERCPGLDEDVQRCNERSCEICAMREWTEWGRWGSCSATCGFGMRSRRRYCEFLSLLEDGEIDCGIRSYENCRDEGTEEQACPNLPSCPPPTEWTPWRPCSVTCRGDMDGIRERVLMVRSPDGRLVEDRSRVERERCGFDLLDCPTWGPWGSCSSTCRGEGMRQRTFMMINNLGSLVSDSSRVETERCPEFGPECAKAFWGTWEKWCPCDCRTGQRSRRRECQMEDRASGVVNTVSIDLCQGLGRESKSCDVVGICPECITTCRDQPDGVYASCTGCADFIRCTGEEGEDNIMRCSRPNTQFDGFVDKCVTAPSPSCSLQDCVTDCRDVEDGDYHSCSNCSSFVRCNNGRFEEMSCPDARMEFNGHFGMCMGTRSPTCKRSRTITRSATSVGIVVNDAPVEEYYDEVHGLNAEERRLRYERMRKKTPEELREIEVEQRRLGAQNAFDIEVARDSDEDSIEVEEGGFFDRMKDFIAGATGTKTQVPDCLSSCGNLTEGRYPSCRGCEFYWRCFKNVGRERRCTNNRMWDNSVKRCLITSSTCPGT